MPTISTTPAIPLPTRPCRVTCTADTAPHPGNAIRVWCTAAPPGSALRDKLDKSGASRVAVATVDTGRFFEFTPEKGGGYVFVLDELKRGSGFRGGYEGDPRGAPSETLLDSSTPTLRVAGEYAAQLGFGADRATLIMHALENEIVRTTLVAHGVVSPRIDLPSQPTSRARLAAESDGVRLALSLLGKVAYPTDARIVGDPGEVIDSLIYAFNFHARNGTEIHAEADTDNVVPDSFRSPQSLGGMVTSLSRLRQSLDRHIRNDNPSATPPGTGSAAYHSGEEFEVDWGSVPLSALGVSEATLHAAIADTRRALASHSLSDVHGTVGLFGLVDLFQSSVLLWMHEQFITELAALSPTAPATANPIGAVLVGRGGFKES